ncbi:hypothetical protein [Desulfotomaculum sp. 1211_IL3151]|uniref:hypothetical protein n=1 Tax=Desulfotomaculum sp. 1211_IL3151 TaxID=3084055 RepID=UPI002FDB5ECE
MTKPLNPAVYLNIKGTKTENNLLKAFAGASMARNKDTYFASVARKEGYDNLLQSLKVCIVKKGCTSYGKNSFISD